MLVVLGRVSRRRIVIIAFVCALALVSSAFAESDIAIRGTIIDDASGSPIDQATVRVEGTALTATSESDGSFEIRAVPLGSWSLTVERSGYHLRHLDDVEVVEGFSRNLRVVLVPNPVELPSQDVESPRTDSRDVRRMTIPIEQAGSRSVEELLEQIPGVRVYGSSDSPGGTRISVGGEPASRVAVMLDGMPLSGGSDGAVDLSSIPVSALTAIEVHAGSQSVIAGDAAVGGAVNLITHHNDGTNGVRLTTVGGEWGRTRQEATASEAWSNVMLSAGGEYDQRRSPYKFVEVNSDTTGFRQNARLDERRLFLKVNSPRQRSLEVLGYASRNERGAPGTVERPMLAALTRNKNGRVQASREFALSSSQNLTAAGWYEFSSEYYNAASERIPQHSYLREHFVGAKAAHSTALSLVEWNSEFETRRRAIHGDDFQRPGASFGDQERTEYSVRTRLSRYFKWISLHGGIALDADADNSPGWSPRVDLSVHPVRVLAVGLGWGQSFRRPLLVTAFWKGDYYAQGNPNLSPERAEEWDASIRWRHRFITIDSRYFERRIDDIIVWDLRGVPQKYTPVNLSSGRIIGREDHVALTFIGGGVSIDYSHVFNDGTDHSGEPNYDGKTLPFTPRHTHDCTIRGSHGPIAALVTGRWVSMRQGLRANSNRWQAPYRAFDADLRLTPRSESPHVVVFLRAENITNEPIELLQGYPSPARTISAGITVEFN